MPTEKKSSDRERILRLIDGEPKAVKEAEQQKRAQKLANRLTDFFVGSFKKSIGGVVWIVKSLPRFLIDLARGRVSLASLSFRTVNKILILGLIVSVIYLTVDVLNNTVFKTQTIIEELKESDDSGLGSLSQFLTDTEMTELNPLKYYIEDISSKDVFNADRIELAGGEGGLTSFAGLKFVGVDWDEDPVAMIEDLNSGRTFFVRTGDSIKDILITEVLKDRVIFQFKGNYYELK